MRLAFTIGLIRTMDVTAIEARILQAMPDAQVSIETPDNVHYTARVVSAEFDGLTRLQRHRRVHAAVGEALGREIHAMSFDLKTPDESG